MTNRCDTCHIDLHAVRQRSLGDESVNAHIDVTGVTWDWLSPERSVGEGAGGRGAAFGSGGRQGRALGLLGGVGAGEKDDRMLDGDVG